MQCPGADAGVSAREALMKSTENPRVSLNDVQCERGAVQQLHCIAYLYNEHCHAKKSGELGAEGEEVRGLWEIACKAGGRGRGLRQGCK